LIFLFLCTVTISIARQNTFRFVYISDTHIGLLNGNAEEDSGRMLAGIRTNIIFTAGKTAVRE
jgi:hypothetical protein